MPAAVADKQDDLFHGDYLSDPRDWQAIRILCDEIEAEMAERRRHLLRRVCDWLTLLSVFRAIEEKKLIIREACPRDMEFHRAIITSILGSGELLLLDLREHTGIDPLAIGVSFEDFEAHVRMLRYDLRARHGDLTPEAKKAILSDVFGFPK